MTAAAKDTTLLSPASPSTTSSSLQLHHRLGFCQVSRFSEVGRKFDRRIDVIDLELVLYFSVAALFVKEAFYVPTLFSTVHNELIIAAEMLFYL